MQLQIRTMSNVHPDFYRLIGPLMGSRKVEKEVGIRLYDDEDKEWYTAWLCGTFIGVASVNKGRVVSDCYVKPQYRGQGALTEMLKSILKDHTVNLRANCTKMSAGVFASVGFKLISKTKNFYRMEVANA